MKTQDLSPGDYSSFYAGYIGLLPNEELLEILKVSKESTTQFFTAIPSAKHDYFYAEGKWTVKEVFQHIIDTERIMSYRALRFARRDTIELPGFDQDQFVNNSNANLLDFQDLVEEYTHVRNASISLFKNFNEETLKQRGIGNKKTMSVAAVAFIIAGHEQHHCKIIKERYL